MLLLTSWLLKYVPNRSDDYCVRSDNQLWLTFLYSTSSVARCGGGLELRTINPKRFGRGGLENIFERGETTLGDVLCEI